VKNLGGLKKEILRCAQNDKKSLLIAYWYQVGFVMGSAERQGQL
jgi:hypothetical protein